MRAASYLYLWVVRTVCRSERGVETRSFASFAASIWRFRAGGGISFGLTMVG